MFSKNVLMKSLILFMNAKKIHITATILYTTYSKRHHFCLKIFNNIETFLRSRRNIRKKIEIKNI